MTRKTAAQARLTREQSQSVTRAQLLKAARAEIARHGIAGATVRGVSEAAGYSQGAFYSNFASKEALLAELLEDQLLKLAEDFNDLIRRQEHAGLDAALDAVVQWLMALHANRTWSMLMLEMQLYSSRNPGFAASFGDRKQGYLKGFSEGFERLFEKYGRKPALPPLHMAIGFIALWNGFSLQRMGDYPVPPREVYLAFLRALFAQAASRPPVRLSA